MSSPDNEIILDMLEGEWEPTLKEKFGDSVSVEFHLRASMQTPGRQPLIEIELVDENDPSGETERPTREQVEFLMNGLVNTYPQYDFDLFAGSAVRP